MALLVSGWCKYPTLPTLRKKWWQLNIKHWHCDFECLLAILILELRRLLWWIFVPFSATEPILSSRPRFHSETYDDLFCMKSTRCFFVFWHPISCFTQVFGYRGHIVILVPLVHEFFAAAMFSPLEIDIAQDLSSSQINACWQKSVSIAKLKFQIEEYWSNW